MKDKLTTAIQALEQIATGYIDGQPNDYKTSLYICRQIAQETLDKLR